MQRQRRPSLHTSVSQSSCETVFLWMIKYITSHLLYHWMQPYLKPRGDLLPKAQNTLLKPQHQLTGWFIGFLKNRIIGYTRRFLSGFV